MTKIINSISRLFFISLLFATFASKAQTVIGIGIISTVCVNANTCKGGGTSNMVIGPTAEPKSKPSTTASCSDGSTPTCDDGSTPNCSGLCDDGSTATCDDGSTPACN